MSFVAALALALGLFAAVPYLAHRLRQVRAEEQPFAFLRLVPQRPPRARRRSALADKPLFAVRLLTILAIAVLGATPLLTCNRVELGRRDGASVALAIVLDDSMSMRARPRAGEPSRFEQAKRAVAQLLEQTQSGDSVSLILAGHPARRLIAPTVDRDAIASALSALEESDRGTDLDGALSLAKSSLDGLPHVDKRVLVFSDRADGQPDAAPLGEGFDSVYFPLESLAGELPNCGLLSASRQGSLLKVELRCAGGASLRGRTLRVSHENQVLWQRELSEGDAPTVLAPIAGLESALRLEAELSAGDALEADDRLPVDHGLSRGAIGVLTGPRDESLATGGAPVIERALLALQQPAEVRALSTLPDTAAELGAYAALVLDDPSGFTPEERAALQRFLQDGHMVLLTLGPRAHAAPLGASFEPMVRSPFRYGPSPASGLAPRSLRGALAASAAGLEDLELRERTALGEQELEGAEVLATYADGAPFWLRKSVGRGVLWLFTAPFSLDANGFALRPGFIDLLDEFALNARQRSAVQRAEPGQLWTLMGQGVLHGTDPAGRPLQSRLVPRGVAVELPRIGRYEAWFDADDSARERLSAWPIATELDLRPRAIAASAAGTAASAAAGTAKVDVSWAVALTVMALFVLELALRWWHRQRQTEPSPQEENA